MEFNKENARKITIGENPEYDSVSTARSAYPKRQEAYKAELARLYDIAWQKKQERFAKRQQRINDVVILLRNGVSQAEIASYYKVTRQRINQIAVKYAPDVPTFIGGSRNRKDARPVLDKECAQCSKAFQTKREEQRFCGRPCMLDAKRTTPEELLKRRAEYRRKYYHEKLKNNPLEVEKIRIRNSMYRFMPGKDDMIRGYAKAQRLKLKERMALDPEFAAKKREEWRQKNRKYALLRKQRKVEEAVAKLKDTWQK